MSAWEDDHNGEVLLPWKSRGNGVRWPGYPPSTAVVDQVATVAQRSEGEDAMKPDPNDRIARNPVSSEQADDVATLYSWANLHGAKYRDFSASRQEMRVRMRQRNLADQAQTAREEAQKTTLPIPRWEDLLPDAGPQKTAAPSVRHDLPAEYHFESPAPKDRIHAPAPPPPEAGSATRIGLGGAPYFRDAAPGEPRNAARPEPEIAEVRPAWLAETPPAPAPAASPAPFASPVPQAIVQTPQVSAPASMVGIGPLQPSRQPVPARWYALRSVFGRSTEELQPARFEGQVPTLALFSLAGGVGKTSLAAGIGRVLAARGERILLTDTSSFGVLPFYFGAREIKPGVVRTFSGGTSDPPIRVLTLQTERYDSDPDLLRREMVRGTHEMSRVVIDIATGSAAMLAQAARLLPLMIVPLVPDMASVVTLPALEAFFRNQEGANGRQLQAWYVLNQFDPASPLQLDVREVLRQQLGERLLPFAIHRSPAMSEALAEGMTIIDYAPNSPAAEDVIGLATWIRNTSAAVGLAQRGVRWSER